MATPTPDSSLFSAIDYDEVNYELTIWIRGSRHSRYTYINVPLLVYGKLSRAPSAGRLFNKYIRCRYEFR